jgi:hypothetical protein
MIQDGIPAMQNVPQLLDARSAGNQQAQNHIDGRFNLRTCIDGK